MGSLRSDLKASTKEVAVLGPWIDDYFVAALIEVIPRPVHIRVVTRPLAAMSEEFRPWAEEARRRLARRGGVELRVSPRLHAKLILIDESTFYCGSANWYRYSVEQGLEVVLRGPIEAAPALLDEVAAVWRLAQPEANEALGPPKSERPTGYDKEVLDPIAAEVLRRVPGSYVLGPKRRR
jgi:phosphatidylserine/phosphatidylglycerophosphate/cardiolipin synthase-like enzyme